MSHDIRCTTHRIAPVNLEAPQLGLDLTPNAVWLPAGIHEPLLSHPLQLLIQLGSCYRRCNAVITVGNHITLGTDRVMRL